MNGPDHFKAAENCISDASSAARDPDITNEEEGLLLGYALTHAVLALAAATAFSHSDTHRSTNHAVDEWREVAS